MKLFLDLSRAGNLELSGLPSNRTLEFPATPEGLALIIKTLKGAKRSFGRDAQPPGHCRDFPTQHIIDKWLIEAAKTRQEESAKRHGVNLDNLEMKL